ncbi:MAG: hypothetical protein JOZ78_19685 [Chroococcidiopsidaceae cyanobacterium CP_BM_ER_R8_30]|nr:hypothetical protein [Chroococcidiopsidaceae cyanobacterium CP_BM_ER_R8_30]
MPKVLIVTEASRGTADSLVIDSMVSALKRAIPATMHTQVTAINQLQLLGSMDLELVGNECQDEQVICALTLNLPDTLSFPARSTYKACQDVSGLRQILMEKFEISSANGCFWLPVVLTAKGPLYGEAIALQERKVRAEETSARNFVREGTSARNFVREGLLESLPLDVRSFYQPCHFPDAIRQKLYHLGYCLMLLLEAPPATYLVQFTVQESIVYFDRLWPFPAAPALASIGVQKPDLFTCHWCCLSGQPVLDLTIMPTVTPT